MLSKIQKDFLLIPRAAGYFRFSNFFPACNISEIVSLDLKKVTDRQEISDFVGSPSPVWL